MTQCSRCEILPEALPERGKLYLSTPVKPTGASVENYFQRLALQYEEVFPNIFKIFLNAEELTTLCSQYFCKISPLELEDTRCLFLAEDECFDVHMLVRMQTLEALVARIRGQWLLEMLRAERIETWFQSIVEASDPSRVFAHECLMRGRDEQGNLISPGEIFPIARSADLLFNLDRLCRISAIRNAGKLNLETCLFINFNPAAIYSPEYCLQTTLAAVRKAGLPVHRVVFEVVESDEVNNAEHLLDILNFYRRKGFQVALDDLGAGYSSLNLLSKLKPDFIKIDMELIRGVDRDGYKEIITSNLIKIARELKIRVIAEGVESVGEWKWLSDRHVDFIQGFLFAKPSNPPLKPEIPID